MALASETHTHTHAKKHRKKEKPKRSTKRTVTPVNPGVATRLVMRLELQIGEIPLRFSGISLFGPEQRGGLQHEPPYMLNTLGFGVPPCLPVHFSTRFEAKWSCPTLKESKVVLPHFERK